MSVEDFKKQYMLKLQGKDYLPVAPRVVLFRQEHPDWTIQTGPVDIGGETYIRAEVSRMNQHSQAVLVATAHKRVRKDGKGPVGQFPVEAAETGAIGRALSLCGYGTIEGGDLDEGEDIADAPVEKAPTRSPKAKITKDAAEQTTAMVAKLDAVKTLDQFNQAYDEALCYLEGMDKNSDAFKLVAQAGTRARNRVAK